MTLKSLVASGIKVRQREQDIFSILFQNQVNNYYWDEINCKYVHGVNGRPVSETFLQNIIRQRTTMYEMQVSDLVQAVYDEAISPSVFAVQMGQTLKRQAIQMAALAVGGFDNLIPQHYGRMGGLLGADYRRLRGFATDIMEGKVSEAQSLNRARMYVGNQNRNFYSARCEPRLKADEMIIERRMLQPAEHCADCIRYANMGWQPLGVLPDPGIDSQCLSNCRCLKIRRVIKRGERSKWIGRRRRG